MSKKLITKYLFTPGSAGAGTVKVTGKILLDSIVLITNVTRNQVIYNAFDPLLGGVVSYNNADTTTFVNTIDGISTITLAANTSSMSSGDKLQIIVDGKELIIRPYDFGTDAIERIRTADPQSLIDADFEYGLQPTKWQNLGLVRNYPGIYEIPGTDLIVSVINSDGGANSLISVTTVDAHTFTAGTPITMQGLSRTITGYSRAEGSFLVAATPAPSSNTFSYYAKGNVGTGTSSLLTDTVQLRKGGFYTGSNIASSGIVSDGLSPSTITVTTTSNHGLTPGMPIVVDVTSAGTGHESAEGPFYVERVISPSSFSYTARTGVVVSTVTTLTANIYIRSDAFFMHRPYDGGVLISTGGPAYGMQAIRSSKKYFRYQSGKGLLFTTGTLLRPNYDTQSVTAAATTVGSVITVTTDGVDHGLQPGAQVRIAGITTTGYNDTYIVNSILTDTSFTVLAQSTLGNVTGSLETDPKVYVTSWVGAAVRLGIFDEQNGIFWEHDGQNLYAVVRSATTQLAGLGAINADSNVLTGTNTRFQDQLKVGDDIVIRGMTHSVTSIASHTSITVAPDFRGATNVSGVRLCLVKDLRVSRENFNRDSIDGNGPSGYNLDLNKMQMMGIQYTWYGAGFIDFMVRGVDGNFVIAHRIKNNNVNNEAYMRSGNLPARYTVVNEGYVTRLASAINSTDNTLTLVDGLRYPQSGTIFVDNEIISYSSRSGNVLSGLTRAATLTHFSGGSVRNFTAGIADVHATNAGVLLLTVTCSPTLSHWGSAVIMDGKFDTDRGYLFNYQRLNIAATATNQTAFSIRLAPSVSNAIVGDLGARDLLNRSQLLLEQIEITTASANSIVVEAVLNPQNYPVIPANATWVALTPLAQGGQPSLAQVSTTVTWTTGAFALPGEQVFSFVSAGSDTKVLDLGKLKELTATSIGGRGAFPNGPDVLSINVRTVTGTATAQIVLRWAETQA